MVEEIKQLKYELIQVEQHYKYKSTMSLFITGRTLYVIGRNAEDRAKRVFFLNDFYPRFWAERIDDLDDILEIEIEGKFGKKVKDFILKIEYKEDGDEYRSLVDEKELITIYTHLTDDIPLIRDYFNNYEANVKFTEAFKRKKLIKGYFFVPEYVIKDRDRFYKIDGVEYIMLYEAEITGGELEF